MQAALCQPLWMGCAQRAALWNNLRQWDETFIGCHRKELGNYDTESCGQENP